MIVIKVLCLVTLEIISCFTKHRRKRNKLITGCFYTTIMTMNYKWGWNITQCIVTFL